MSEKLHEDFEEAMRANGYKQFSRKGDRYTFDDIDSLWQGFKLGRESLEIELPEWFDYHDSGERAYWADLVESAITKSGAKIKE